MKPLRNRLEEARKRTGLPWEVLERDYILSWVLAGIYRVEAIRERQPHPAGQEAFRIRARLPWHRQLHSRVMVEITVDEQMLKPISTRPVIHDYGEPLEVAARVYALEEIVGEKLRAIL